MVENRNRKIYDQRTYRRYIEKGLLKDSEYENHIKQMPDDSGNASWVQFDLHDSELGEVSSESDTDKNSSGVS